MVCNGMSNSEGFESNEISLIECLIYLFIIEQQASEQSMGHSLNTINAFIQLQALFEHI